MELKFSKVTRKGPVTIVTLSRPEVYNALHIDAHFELNKVFDDFSADPDQWVAVVTGARQRKRAACWLPSESSRRERRRGGRHRTHAAGLALVVSFSRIRADFPERSRR
jgi:1,4-dihydroxy-2-naphthoyl-CoA synthase